MLAAERKNLRGNWDSLFGEYDFRIMEE